MNEKTAILHQANNEMLTTDVIMKLNMGFVDGFTERKLTENELKTHFTQLRCHMCNVLPEPDVLGLEDKINRIAFKSLELGEWTPSDYGTWSSLPPSSPTTYGMQLTVSILHEAPLLDETVAEVINVIYDNGASFPLSFEEDDNYFLYPYHTAVVRQ